MVSFKVLLVFVVLLFVVNVSEGARVAFLQKVGPGKYQACNNFSDPLGGGDPCSTDYLASNVAELLESPYASSSTSVSWSKELVFGAAKDAIGYYGQFVAYQFDGTSVCSGTPPDFYQDIVFSIHDDVSDTSWVGTATAMSAGAVALYKCSPASQCKCSLVLTSVFLNCTGQVYDFRGFGIAYNEYLFLYNAAARCLLKIDTTNGKTLTSKYFMGAKTIDSFYLDRENSTVGVLTESGYGKVDFNQGFVAIRFDYNFKTYLSNMIIINNYQTVGGVAAAVFVENNSGLKFLLTQHSGQTLPHKVNYSPAYLYACGPPNPPCKT